MWVTDCLQDSHHCVGQGASEASSLTYYLKPDTRHLKPFILLRRKEMKRLKDKLSDEKYSELKGVMWILRKKPEKLRLFGNSCGYANIEYPFKSNIIL